MRGKAVSLLTVVIFALTAAIVLAELEKQRDVQKKAPTSTNTYSENHAKNSTSITEANGKEKKAIKDPLLILWIGIGIAGFLMASFIICYCLFKYCDGGDAKEASEIQLPEHHGNKQTHDVEALQTLQEEGQVIEFLQMLEESSRKSLERNLGPPRKEDFGSDKQLHGSRPKSSYIIPQKLTEPPDGDGFGPPTPPYNCSTVQPHLDTPFYNYGFEDEESFRSELRHAHTSYCWEMNDRDGQWDGDCREMMTGQTHRRLWYEDSISECNDNIFTTNRLEQSCAENDEYDQQQHYLGDSYICYTGNLTGGSADEREHAQSFCVKANDIIIDSHHGTGKDTVIEIVTVKSEFIQQDKGNVAESLFNSNRDKEKQKKQEFENTGGDFEEDLDKNNPKRAIDFDEFDDVEFGFSGHVKRIRSSPESTMVVTHATDDITIYQELLRGSIAALAIANGVKDVPFDNQYFIQEKKKLPLKESTSLLGREKKRSFKSKEYGSLVNERENNKENLCRQSVIRRVSKRRRDSRQRFKESRIGKQTRRFSKKVAKGLSKVKSKTQDSSSQQSPTFVVASL